jgi:hypothetical protein
MPAHVIAGYISVSEEMMREAQQLRDIIHEAELDLILGPRYGPGRAELWDIERPARLRADLAPGHPAGRYRRH